MMAVRVQDHHWIEQAIGLAAREAQAGGAPFAGLVVANGRCLGEGVNKVAEICDPVAHAEVMAIRNASRCLGVPLLSGATLYTVCPVLLSACRRALTGGPTCDRDQVPG